MGRHANRCAIGLAVFTIVVAGMAAPASAILSRNILKSFFEKGDKPTESQFANFIDSFIHLTDDGLTLTGIGGNRHSGTGPNGQGLRIGGNVGINEVLPDTGEWLAPSLHPEMEPLWAGQTGFLPLRYESSAGLAHYGFLQISMETATAAADPLISAAAEPPAIFVEYWVWEPSPGTTVTTSFVPEPTAALGLALAASVALARRRRAH
ncbi:MAG: hypothetical protein QOF78_224 [Phycisphaerales bacterium]|jgi:hypothetical protein|nr:hypothetical protein [Phycisphaerales bacterium]